MNPDRTDLSAITGSIARPVELVTFGDLLNKKAEALQLIHQLT